MSFIKYFSIMCQKKQVPDTEVHKLSVGDRIPLGSNCISTPSMGGYPDYLWRSLLICEDGYKVEYRITDMLHRVQEESECFIKIGFFAQSNINKIAATLSYGAFIPPVTPKEISNDQKFKELIAFDKERLENSPK